MGSSGKIACNLCHRIDSMIFLGIVKLMGYYFELYFLSVVVVVGTRMYTIYVKIYIFFTLIQNGQVLFYSVTKMSLLDNN